MVYNFNEYKNGFKVFDTPAKVQQEKVIVDKIMSLLNKNKYDNLDDFIKRNPSYQDFLRNNNMENVVKHFGNTLNELDFKRILESLRKLTEYKSDFDKNIKTTNIDDKEYNSFKGQDKSYFIDNSGSNKIIEEQLQDLQQTQGNFQTSDVRQNTENMFKELEQSKKDTINLEFLSEINRQNLSKEELELFEVAANYQLDFQDPIRVDLKKGIIVDAEDNIMKIEKRNNEFVITGDENTNDDKEIEASQVQKSNQKQFVMKKNTVYNDNQ